MQQDKVIAQGPASISSLIDYINIGEVQVPPGKVARAAITAWRNGRPFIGYIQCAVDTHGGLFSPDAAGSVSGLSQLDVE
jgi:hypothetical protein